MDSLPKIHTGSNHVTFIHTENKNTHAGGHNTNLLTTELAGLLGDHLAILTLLLFKALLYYSISSKSSALTELITGGKVCLSLSLSLSVSYTLIRTNIHIQSD